MTLNAIANPRWAALAAMLVSAALPALAQIPILPMDDKAAPAMATSFDVISVKMHAKGQDSTSLQTHPDSFGATNISVKLLLMNAYGLREGLISGLPGWAESDRFDVSGKITDPDAATAHGSPGRDVYQARIQSILKERFHLEAHRETKTLPIYNLVQGKAGTLLKPSVPETPEQAAARPQDAFGPGSYSSGNGYLTGVAIPLSTLVFSLSSELNRNVIDQTGLTGKYDMELKWTPEASAMAADNGTKSEEAGPPLFTALEEQLGLRLVSAKGPVETLVVDHIEQPAPN